MSNQFLGAGYNSMFPLGVKAPIKCINTTIENPGPL